MFRSAKIKQHLTPSTAIAFLALIFAVTGVSFAATGGGGASNGSHATLTATASKAKPKTKTGPRGPAGKNGAPGATGATGATGPAGPTGPAGTNGTNGTGTAGANGANGESVKVEAASGTECTTGGGAKVSNASGTALACNGAKGLQGKEGNIPATLLPGHTETGTWAAAGPADGPPGLFKGSIYAPISFTIPLATAPKVNIVESGKGKGGGTCPTSSELAKPEAEEGNLCIFVQSAVEQGRHNVELVDTLSPEGAFEGAGTMGTVVVLLPEEEGKPEYAFGSWAVTAAE